MQRVIGPYFGNVLTFIRMPQVGRNAINIAMVYFFTCLAWVFFRSSDFPTALSVITGIGSLEGFNFASVINKFWVAKGFLLIGILVLIELADIQFDFSKLILNQPVFRVVSFASILWLIAFLGSFGANSFIYFQF